MGFVKIYLVFKEVMMHGIIKNTEKTGLVSKARTALHEARSNREVSTCTKVEGGAAAGGVGVGTVIALVGWGLNHAYARSGDLALGVYNEAMSHCGAYRETGLSLCEESLVYEKFVELAKVALSSSDYTPLMWVGVGIAGVSLVFGFHAGYKAWKGEPTKGPGYEDLSPLKFQNTGESSLIISDTIDSDTIEEKKESKVDKTQIGHEDSSDEEERGRKKIAVDGNAVKKQRESSASAQRKAKELAEQSKRMSEDIQQMVKVVGEGIALVAPQGGEEH